MMRCEGVYVPRLASYAWTVSDYLLRCVGNYKGGDAIRNRDKTTPKDPLYYPPVELKDLLAEATLSDDRLAVDLAATRLLPAFNHLSLAYITAEAVFCARNFSLPVEHSETLEVEYDLYPKVLPATQKLVYLKDKIWAGKIDWVFRRTDKAIVIADHKTSKTLPTQKEVSWNPQLNLYAALYYEATGKLTDLLALVHLRTNSVVYAPLYPEAVAQIYTEYSHLQARIDTGLHSKRFPEAYQSPCLEKNLRTGQVIGTCPYLDLCWTQYQPD